MDCRQFQDDLSDAACGTLIEASARQAVLAHVAVCSACAARLASEHALTASLGELGRAEAGVAAPARVKSALLAAYREGNGPQMTQMERIFANQRRTGSRFLVIAASVLLLAVPVGYALWPSQKHDVESPVTPVQSAQYVDSQPPAQVLVHPMVTPTPVVRTQQKRATLRPARTVAKTTETVTDYIPLTYLDDATAMESGQVVRIDVPRSSLAAFGLPVSQDRLDERVKADIIIGDDGLARAIRFVQ
ncbi:MAG TPA: hypothetical protein PLF26_14270 [Blastocatellia bacterium]|nr:hypothetical protein [Blastocatellia bacterium]